MKGLICVLVLALNYISFSQSYPHLFELRGLEDSLGNTHLFYRYVYPSAHCWSRNIYHYDLSTNIDTIYIRDLGYEVYQGWGCEGNYIYDYEFFDNDPTKYIYGGYNLRIDPVALLRRYDGDIQLEAFALTEIEISKLDERLVYVSAGQRFFKSTDGGYNFNYLDSIMFIDHSMISLSRNDDSQIYGVNNNKLVRSEDEGYSYIIVDDSQWDDFSELFYDPDGNHIYGVSNYYDYQTQSYSSKIYVSNDNGNPFSWTNTINRNLPIRFTHDEYQSGEVYYSFQRKIYKSTDYGSTFELYKLLDRNINGLYKKSGTDILYASTPLKIYEISPDTMQVIKSLPIPEEVLSYYPLAIGNKWIYDTYGWWADTAYHDYSKVTIREVIGDTLMPNGRFYYKLYDPTTFNYPLVLFERIDSVYGKVFRYDSTLGLPNDEYLIEDLFAELGDTVWSSRHQYQDYFPFICVGENFFNKWGTQGQRKTFTIYDLTGYTYSLTQGIGIDTIYSSFDFGENFATLKGYIIDGIVYGDTTVISVDDEELSVVSSFTLEQNYPNPFNPTTKIKFTIPTSPLNPSPYQGEGQRERLVTLKVYDVLGTEIAILVNEQKPAGTYEVEFDATGLPSGIYFYRLTAGSYSATKKMLLLK
jgi:hypothetical protein